MGLAFMTLANAGGGAAVAIGARGGLLAVHAGRAAAPIDCRYTAVIAGRTY